MLMMMMMMIGPCLKKDHLEFGLKLIGKYSVMRHDPCVESMIERNQGPLVVKVIRAFEVMVYQASVNHPHCYVAMRDQH